MGCIALVRWCWCYVVVWLGWCGVRMQVEAVPQPAYHTSNQSNTTQEITQQTSRKLLGMDVLTSEICWALNNEIIKQMTSSWSVWIHISSTISHTLDINSIFSFFGHFQIILLPRGKDRVTQTQNNSKNIFHIHLNACILLSYITATRCISVSRFTS